MSVELKDQVVAAFAKLAAGRGDLAAEFIDCLRCRGGMAAFQQAVLGEIQAVLSSESPLSQSSEPPPPSEPVRRHDDAGFLLPEYRTPSVNARLYRQPIPRGTAWSA
jgi:hypothetical protein